MEFAIGDFVFIKIALMEGIMRFRKNGKLSLHYVVPFEIVNYVGRVAYELTLPAEMSTIHNVFHLSMLKKYIANPEHVIVPQTVQIQADLSYEDRSLYRFLTVKLSN